MANGNVKIRLNPKSRKKKCEVTAAGPQALARFEHDEEVCMKFTPQKNQRTYFRRGPVKDPKRKEWQRYPVLKQLPKEEIKVERAFPSSAPPSPPPRSRTASPAVVVTSAVGFWREKNRSKIRESRQKARLRFRRSSILNGQVRPQPQVQHQQQHYFDAKMNTQVLPCKLCEEIFFQRRDLVIHLEDAHHLCTRLDHRTPSSTSEQPSRSRP